MTARRYPRKSDKMSVQVAMYLNKSVDMHKNHALLYFAQAFHLRMFVEPLFEDEIHASYLGPCVIDAFTSDLKGEENLDRRTKIFLDNFLAGFKLRETELRDLYKMEGSRFQLAMEVRNDPHADVDAYIVMTHEEMIKADAKYFPVEGVEAIRKGRIQKKLQELQDHVDAHPEMYTLVKREE